MNSGVGTIVAPLPIYLKMMPLHRSAIALLYCLISSVAWRPCLAGEQVYCPILGTTDANTAIQSNDFGEISGLAISPSQVSPATGAPVLFVINDSGGGSRLGLFDSATGKRLLTVLVPTSNSDWESMSIGSCGVTDMNKTCIYIADTGDNRARLSGGDFSRRESRYKIVRIEEPLLGDFVDNEMIPDSYVSILRFSYRSESSPTNSADSEAMFVDNAGWGDGGAIGDLYLVTKWDESDARTKTRLFKIPTEIWLDTTERYEPEAVGSYDGGGDLMGITWTGAEASFDGTLISLVGYTERQRETTNYMFLRCPGSSVADALAAPNGTTQHCLAWKSPSQGKLETLAWDPNGIRILNIPEGLNENIGVTSFVYDSMSASQSCSEDANVTTQQPTAVPSAAPSFATITKSPTAMPVTQPSIAPTWPRPPTVSPTSISSPSTSPVTSSVRTMVALADFQIDFVPFRNDAFSATNMTVATGNFLLESMFRDFTTLKNIELTATTRRRLQGPSVQTIQYSGNAVFDGSDVALFTAQVLESQTNALEDIDSLQMAYNEANVDIVVEQVVVQAPESPPSSSSTNAGLIAGVSVAAAVLLALGGFIMHKWWHKRNDYKCKNAIHLDNNGGPPPPPPPPREDFTEYAPNDFQPSSPKSLSLIESATHVHGVEQDLSVEVCIDEYSLSAASLGSFVKKDPEARRESPRTNPTKAVTQVSLLDQSGQNDWSSGEEEDSLPPPVPVSTGRSSQWALDTSDHQLVPSESPSLFPQHPYYGDEPDTSFESSHETRLAPMTARKRLYCCCLSVSCANQSLSTQPLFLSHL